MPCAGPRRSSSVMQSSSDDYCGVAATLLLSRSSSELMCAVTFVARLALLTLQVTEGMRSGEDTVNVAGPLGANVTTAVSDCSFLRESATVCRLSNSVKIRR